MSEDLIIFRHTDQFNDTVKVTSRHSIAFGGPFAEITTFGVGTGNPWLTPAESKRLRKALKQWEKSVTEAEV